MCTCISMKLHIIGQLSVLVMKSKSARICFNIFGDFGITLYNVCSVHRGIPRVHRGIISTSEEHHEYIGGCSLYQRDTMCTSGGYHDTCGGIMSTLGDVQYIRGCLVHRSLQQKLKGFYQVCSPTCIMIPSDVLNIPRCTHDIPLMYSFYPSDVLNIPRCTSWYPPTFIMISP